MFWGHPETMRLPFSDVIIFLCRKQTNSCRDQKGGHKFKKQETFRFPTSSSVNIHSDLFRIFFALHHAEKFPSIFFIKICKIRDQIEWCDPFPLHICYNCMQQMSCNSLPSIFFFGIYAHTFGVRSFLL